LFGKALQILEELWTYYFKNNRKDYLFSWYVKNKSLQDNTKPALKIIIRKNTRQNLYNTIKQNAKHEINIESTTLKHNPKLDFYSADVN
jgi:hypothetical protein